MGTLSIRLPEELDEKLEQEARLLHKKRSELAREAIAEYIEARERERFMGEFIAEARAVYGDETLRREAQEIAEEFLPFDNEALDAAEGRKPGKSLPEEKDNKWWK
jgi:metal-responsive CopG/Arc/MetJ family transcriptional regulator